MKRKAIRGAISKAQTKRKSHFSDIAAMGPEPASQGKKFEPTKINMLRAYNWYNYYYDVADARKWVVEYMKLANKIFTAQDVKHFSALPNKEVPLWVCVNARMLLSGCSMPDGTTAITHNRIKQAIELHRKEKEEAAPVANNVVVLREYPILATLDELLDQFYNGDFKYFAPGVYDLIKDAGYKTNDAIIAYKHYADLLLEVIEAGEGYDHLGKRKLNAYEKFLEEILSDLKLFATNERTVRKTRKPRARKVKSANQLVAKVKFKAEDRAMKLAGLHPEKLIGMNAAWLFNTKYRKLTYVVAAEGKTLSVKGTTIINIDPEKTVFKRLRKPEILHEMLKGTPAKMLREFKKVKTKEDVANGRLNAETMILKVVK